MTNIHARHFVLTSFYDALVTFVSDKVTWRPLQPVLSTGSEHQGQTSISDLNQNSGFTCIFSSGMKEKSVPRITVWHHDASPSDAKLCPEGDRFVDQYLTLILHSYGCRHLILIKFTLKYSAFTLTIFNLTSFLTFMWRRALRPSYVTSITTNG